MVEINNVFTITLQTSQAKGNQLFNWLLDEGILVIPMIANEEGLEDMFRWHMNESHTTDQCQVFRGFLTRRLKSQKTGCLRSGTTCHGARSLQGYLFRSRTKMDIF